MNAKSSMKRTLAALVLGGGAALALTPAAAQADGLPKGQPLTERLGTMVDHPDQAVKDTGTAVGVATAVTSTAAQSSLGGAGTALGGGLPDAPSLGGHGH
ncbi:hypothetical protein [Streptomyces antimicrobicus]|uniref:ATP-binding protein n=1 Tax=Streptomyces antimicrobicus TaxID=2883108 RepID=A0ABS8B548_9ACTN|nr:hypothetical protein [Streptomyces antimicrobicus]MCB5179694.1 hypothetical protein [Streptomyces antimicrobicus]